MVTSKTTCYYRQDAQAMAYLEEAKAFRKKVAAVRRLYADAVQAKLKGVEFEPYAFTKKYWGRLRRLAEFTTNANQEFWTDFDRFVAEFGLAPTRKHRLTRLPYLKKWTKHTTYWEM